MSADVHDWNACYFPDPSLQIFIACGHDEYAVLCDALHETVISIGAFVRALKALKTRVLCNPQSQAILLPKLFQLRNDTVSDARNDFTQEAVHRRFEDIEFVLN